MKKCSYCGRDNPEDALQCSGCGTSDFGAPRAHQPSHLAARFLASFGTGLGVAAIAFYVAWVNTRDTPEISKEQYVTRILLRNLDDQARMYQQKFAAAPASLVKLWQDSFSEPSNAPQLVDGWQHPFLYTSQGTNYLITSLGRDEKPGGNGLDCDLTHNNQYPPASALPLRQFLFEIPNGSMISSCFLAGAAASILAMLLVRRTDLTRPGLIKLAIKLGVTAGGAVMIGAAIAASHLPVQHH